MDDIVTGGAGFIGSHLVDALVAEGRSVSVLDDLSTGRRDWVAADAHFVRGDAGAKESWDALLADADAPVVWHLAADPDVRGSAADPEAHIQRHLGPTLAALEAMRRHDARHLVFTSTSTIYGQAEAMPTPEDYGPLLPISVYGAAKLACESLIAAWCGTYGLRAQLLRFANVVGPRSNHGVTYDFVHKLQRDPERLEILGDGTQTKSYVHVEDTISGIIAAARGAPDGCTPWNIGSLDAIPVSELGDIVADVMGLQPRIEFTGGVGGAGWAGDVKNMRLDVAKLQGLGWSPRHTSADAVRATARSVLAEVSPSQPTR